MVIETILVDDRERTSPVSSVPSSDDSTRSQRRSNSLRIPSASGARGLDSLREAEGCVRCSGVPSRPLFPGVMVQQSQLSLTSLESHVSPALWSKR